LKADILDITGKKIEQIELSDKVFGAKLNPPLIAQAVRVYLVNQRQGNASTKTRGEVQGSSKKIYRQKGTGRARQGTIRAPHRVGGGIAFGPRPRDFELSMSKPMKQKAMFSLLSNKLKEKQMVFVDGLEKVKGKTKETVKFLENLKFEGKKVLFVLPEKMEKLERAIRNVEDVSYEKVNMLNIFQVADAEQIIFLKESVSKLNTN
jgi:large subunit ribosomal protein L4